MDIVRKKRKRKLYCLKLLFDSWSTSAIAAAYFYKYMFKEPCMTSPQTGKAWMNDVLNGNPARCLNAFRMHPEVFKKLCQELELKYGLKASNQMSVVEKLGIFLYTLAIGVSNRDVGERFQRSGYSISTAFHDVLEAITSRANGFKGLARDLIKPKDPTFQLIPPQIKNDKRYMPYFKDCIGCIDGTHIVACIPETQQLRCIGRKGIPTFNVMATCDFDMCFTFASIGWEGSAHGTHVFLHAINTPAMNFPKPPEGKYYLVDKGYPDRNRYMVPYSKTRYHQSQFAHEPPNNIQENFNGSHSSLRSYIERSFGILKGQWKILNRMPKFSVKTQIDVIMATFVLHNYIRGNSEEATLFDFVEQHPNCVPHDGLCDVRGSDTSNEDFYDRSNNMKQIRNDIAALIWNDRRR